MPFEIAMLDDVVVHLDPWCYIHVCVDDLITYLFLYNTWNRLRGFAIFRDYLVAMNKVLVESFLLEIRKF